MRRILVAVGVVVVLVIGTILLSPPSVSEAGSEGTVWTNASIYPDCNIRSAPENGFAGEIQLTVRVFYPAQVDLGSGVWAWLGEENHQWFTVNYNTNSGPQSGSIAEECFYVSMSQNAEPQQVAEQLDQNQLYAVGDCNIRSAPENGVAGRILDHFTPGRLTSIQVDLTNPQDGVLENESIARTWYFGTADGYAPGWIAQSCIVDLP